MSRYARQLAAAQYDNADECDDQDADDARAKREDEAWHKADMRDSMDGDWTIGSYAGWFK